MTKFFLFILSLVAVLAQAKSPEMEHYLGVIEVYGPGAGAIAEGEQPIESALMVGRRVYREGRQTEVQATVLNGKPAETKYFELDTVKGALHSYAWSLGTDRLSPRGEGTLDFHPGGPLRYRFSYRLVADNPFGHGTIEGEESALSGGLMQTLARVRREGESVPALRIRAKSVRISAVQFQKTFEAFTGTVFHGEPPRH